MMTDVAAALGIFRDTIQSIYECNNDLKTIITLLFFIFVVCAILKTVAYRHGG